MSTLTITNLTCPDAVVPADNAKPRSASDGVVIFCLDRSPNDFQLTLASTGDTVTVANKARITLTFDQTGLVLPQSFDSMPTDWSYEQDPLNSKNLRITRTGDKLDITPGSPAVLKIAGVTAEKDAEDSSNLQATFKDVENPPDDVVFSVTFQHAATAAKKNLPVICNFDEESGGNIVYVGSSGGSNWKGPWSASASYNADDGVSFQGSSWKAVRANTNVTPVEGADWTAITITNVNNDRSFTIEYTDTNPAPNATPDVRITVWFDSCPDGKQPRALATDDKIGQIKLAVERQDGTNWSLASASPDKNNRWHMTPANGAAVFGAGASIQISVSGIESLQDAGRSNMYIQFASIDGYNDCTMFVPIDKAGPYRFVIHRDEVDHAEDNNTVDLWTDYATFTPSVYGPLQNTNSVQIPAESAKDIDPSWTASQPLPVVSGGLVLLRPTADETKPRVMFRFGDDALHVAQITQDSGIQLGNGEINSSGHQIEVQGSDEVHIFEMAGGDDGIYQRMAVRFLQVQAGHVYTGHDLSNLDLSNPKNGPFTIDFSRKAGNRTPLVLINATLKGTSFAYTNLDGAEFYNADLTNADLTGANWDYVWIESATIAGVKMDPADLAAFTAICALQTNKTTYGVGHDFTAMTTGRQFRQAALEEDSKAHGYRFDSATFPSGFSFANSWLHYASFSAAHLEGADFTGADLAGVDFGSACLDSANLTGATVSTETSFQEASLTAGTGNIPANLSGLNLTSVNLDGAKLNNANLTKAILTSAYLRNAVLADADLTDAHLDSADLSLQADLSRAKLIRATLNNTTLINAILDHADLTDAVLDGADLTGNASLEHATLIRASLKGARLNDANLRGADLTDAHLEGADLSGADLTGATLTGATRDDNTIVNAQTKIDSPLSSADDYTGPGIVVAYVQAAANGDAGYVAADSDGLNAGASQHYYTDQDHWVLSASLAMPVPNGKTCNVQATKNWGNPTFPKTFFKVAGSIGQPQSINLNTDLIALQDGFVVAAIDWIGHDGCRGYVLGKQAVQGTELVPVAGSSEHHYNTNEGHGNIWIGANSFCMPVCKNTKYRVDLTWTDGSGGATAWFVPVSILLPFTRLQQISFAQDDISVAVTPTNTDGFLVVFLSAADGQRGSVDISVNSNKVVSTSVNFYGSHDNWIAYNTATVPVPKGASYEITRGGDPHYTPGLQAFWVGLEIPGT